jgi:hypothetical protein
VGGRGVIEEPKAEHRKVCTVRVTAVYVVNLHFSHNLHFITLRNLRHIAQLHAKIGKARIGLHPLCYSGSITSR